MAEQEYTPNQEPKDEGQHSDETPQGATEREQQFNYDIIWQNALNQPNAEISFRLAMDLARQHLASTMTEELFYAKLLSQDVSPTSDIDVFVKNSLPHLENLLAAETDERRRTHIQNVITEVRNEITYLMMEEDVDGRKLFENKQIPQLVELVKTALNLTEYDPYHLGQL